VRTWEQVDITGYLQPGKDDFSSDGTIKDTFLARVLIKAFKAAAHQNPDLIPHAKKQIALLRNPKTVAEALASHDADHWREAIRQEMKSLRDKGVYEIKRVPHGRKLIPTRLVLKIKVNKDGTVDKYKARCVVAGYRQVAGLDYNPDDVYSPMTEAGSVRVLLGLANNLDLEIDHLDIKTAFLNGTLAPEERFYCAPPAGIPHDVPPGHGWYMLKGLYGAHQSGAVWAHTWRSWMKEHAPQFKEAGNERCIYVFREGADGTPIDLDTLRGVTLEPGEKLIILVMNTDDMLIMYTANARTLVDDFEAKTCASFEAAPRQPVEQYLGMTVTRNRARRLLTLDARRHVHEYIWHMGHDPDTGTQVRTPLDPHVSYSKADCPPAIDKALRDQVWKAHGKLIHLAVWARPDLAHAVSVLGRYVHNPSPKLWDAYHRIAKYLTRTKDYRLVYGTADRNNMQNIPHGFTDSDWGACLDDRRSTGSYIFFLDGAGVSWKVKLSTTVCLSTQEAEYIALSEATKEALNLRMLLRDLGFGSPFPMPIWCDNKGAIIMSHHPCNKPATRHVEMKEHFSRQHTELGNTKPCFCGTHDMTADFMSKQTPAPTHQRHCEHAFGDQHADVPLAPIQRIVA
jgi:hypothetical protein